MDQKPTSNPLVIKPDNLQITIGVLGVIFPFVLAIGAFARGCEEIQHSISYYYHTCMGDVFVGFMCADAMCLFAYRGFDKKDNWAANLAAFFALGVAIVPTKFVEVVSDCTTMPWFTNLVIHLTSAAAFFLVLAYFSLVLFTKTAHGGHMTTAKKNRNRIYKICGVVMLACLALIALYMLFLHKKFPDLASWKPVFWLESFALLAFGISWLTKAEVFFKD
jgi:hypothetical protein